MSVYVIGDIHGEFDALSRLMSRVDPGRDDVVVQLGDCVNRGPESYKVVEFWLKFDSCQRYVLGGNHEELLFDYLYEGSDQLLESSYGGQATVEDYRRNGWPCKKGDPSSVPADHLQFIMQGFSWTQSILVTSRYIFTHAGYQLDRAPRDQNPSIVRWGKVTGWKAGDPTVVRGHSPRPRVVRRRGLIEVDTGCGMGGALSCLSLEDGRIFTEQPIPRRPPDQSDLHL